MKEIVPCVFPYPGLRPSLFSIRRRRLSRKHNFLTVFCCWSAVSPVEASETLETPSHNPFLLCASPQITLLLCSLSHYFRMTCENVFRRVESCANYRAAFKDPQGPAVLPRQTPMLAGNLTQSFCVKLYTASTKSLFRSVS